MYKSKSNTEVLKHVLIKKVGYELIIQNIAA